jgi:adenylosuccinate lyase
MTLDYILTLFTSVMRRLQVYPHRMKKNLEITRGLIFSQRVMLAMIDKGLKRQEAYEIVQKNAMKTWKSNRSFLSLLKADTAVSKTLTAQELEALFDYQHYMQHVDDIFIRLGLTKSQWQGTIPEA